MKCRKCRKSIAKSFNKIKSSVQHGGGAISKSLLKFLKEDFLAIRNAARERNDRMVKVIPLELINIIIELGDKEQSLKDKKIPLDYKMKGEREVKEKYEQVKSHYKTDLENLSALKDTFYSEIPQISSKWIVKHYINGNIKLLEDIPSRLKENVFRFRSLQKEGLIDKQKRIEDLEGLKGLESFLEDYPIMELKKRKTDQSVEIIYKGDNLIIFHPKTQEAACYLGQGTRWCTATTKGQNMFEHYNEEGPLYIIQPKKVLHDREKYQLHFETISFMDEKDDPVDINDLLVRFPELMSVFPVFKNEVYRGLFTPGGVVKFVFLNQFAFSNKVAEIDLDGDEMRLRDKKVPLELFDPELIILPLGYLPHALIDTMVPLLDNVNDFENGIADSFEFKTAVKAILNETE